MSRAERRANAQRHLDAAREAGRQLPAVMGAEEAQFLASSITAGAIIALAEAVLALTEEN